LVGKPNKDPSCADGNLQYKAIVSSVPGRPFSKGITDTSGPKRGNLLKPQNWTCLKHHTQHVEGEKAKMQTVGWSLDRREYGLETGT
jgi:hypothetical protein